MGVKTPLDRFIDTLKDHHASGDNSSENKEFKRDAATANDGGPLTLESNPRHVHVSGPNSADKLQFKRDAKRDGAVTLHIGWQVWWQAMNGRMCGPALVEHVTFSGGRRWAWVTWDGMERAVSEVIIAAVEPVELERD